LEDEYLEEKENQLDESIFNKKDLLKKIIVWLIVFMVVLMMILLVILDPRFFTFVD